MQSCIKFHRFERLLGSFSCGYNVNICAKPTQISAKNVQSANGPLKNSHYILLKFSRLLIHVTGRGHSFGFIHIWAVLAIFSRYKKRR